MKKVFLSMALTLGVSTLSLAAVQPPLDLRGNPLYTSDFVGVLPCAITASTGTTAVKCMSGRGVVFGVMASSITALTESVVLRDTGTANLTSSSFSAVSPQGNGAAQALNQTTIMVTFPRPIQFTNGLSANLSASPQNNEIWTILYRPLTATE